VFLRSFVFRVTTCLENLEMSGKSRKVEVSGKNFCQRILFIAEFMFGATPVFIRPLRALYCHMSVNYTTY